MHGLHHSAITVNDIFSEFGHELLKDISVFSRFNSKDSVGIFGQFQVSLV